MAAAAAMGAAMAEMLAVEVVEAGTEFEEAEATVETGYSK